MAQCGHSSSSDVLCTFSDTNRVEFDTKQHSHCENNTTTVENTKNMPRGSL